MLCCVAVCESRFTPNINLYRDPRWGRGQETPGEDPYLTSEFAIAFVRGMQEGEDPRYLKTAADCKHYAGYDLENWHGYDRSSYNANISSQDLVESYLPSFEACVNDAQVASVMCSYKSAHTHIKLQHIILAWLVLPPALIRLSVLSLFCCSSVNGVPSCANPFFLQTILRERFHFDEYAWVVSDCGAIEEIYTTHHYTATPEEAVAVALQAGVDQDCGPFYDAHGREAYSLGLITDEQLDRALTRQFGFLIKTGYFDSPAHQPYRQYGISKVNSERNQRAALNAALQSIVLLKNEQSALPIPSDVKTIALIGPNAAVSETLLGNYEGPSPFIVTIPAALHSRSDRFTIQYVQGCDIAGNSTSGFKAAINAAQNADYTVFVGGLDQSQEAEGHDRTIISLPGQQLSLIQQLSKAAKRPIAAIFLGGGQVDLSALKSDGNVGALLWAGYPGQSGGEAIVRVLTGQHSPSGRLPSTQYPAEYVNQLPMTDQSFRSSSSSPGRTYRFYTGDAVYPFGYGLSYTTFDVVIIDGPSTVNVDELLHSPIGYTVNITNTGSVTSDATVLAYYSPDGPSHYVGVEPPFNTLFDFAFVPMLAPGQTSTLWFQMTAKSMVTVDSRGHEWLLPAEWKVSIGEGSDAVKLSVLGEARLMRQWEGDSAVDQPQRKQPKDANRASVSAE